MASTVYSFDALISHATLTLSAVIFAERPPTRQVFDRGDEILQGPPQTVKPPHHDDVALPEVVQHPVKLGAVGEGSRCLVGKDPFTASGGEGVDLELSVLVDGRDAGVANQCWCHHLV